MEGVEDFKHGRVPRAVRERQILRVAEALFVERGYDGASMDELARRAGVSKPVIYSLVESKEALFARCFASSGEELAERVGAAAAAHRGDVAGVLRATALAFLEFVDEHDRAWAMLFSLDSGGRTERALDEIRERQAQFVGALFVQLADARGVELDPRRSDATAYALNGVYEFLARWRTRHPETAPEEVAGWLVEFALPGVESLLGSSAT